MSIKELINKALDQEKGIFRLVTKKVDQEGMTILYPSKSGPIVMLKHFESSNPDLVLA